MEKEKRKEIGECFATASVAAEKDIAIAKDTGNLRYTKETRLQIPFGLAWEMKRPWRVDYDGVSREERCR